MCKIATKIRSIIKYLIVGISYVVNKCIPQSKNLAIFDTSIGSSNLGDTIICDYCNGFLKDVLPKEQPFRVPTHVKPRVTDIRNLACYKNKILCGTNIISPDIGFYFGWKMPKHLFGYFNIITLAVGLGCYSKEITKKSAYLYRIILSKKSLHSVRDSYTEQMFRKMGIHNVINTGCVTLWKLTPDFCAEIPVTKASKVITTITDYHRDFRADREMLEILAKNYDTIYIWPQGENDLEYINGLIDTSKVTIVDRNLEAYRKILRQGDVDYVGTRLHAGIDALNHKVRSIVIAIDNRAIELGRDVNLPLVHRNQIGDYLQLLITSAWETKLNIPWENIDRWKEQFR